MYHGDPLLGGPTVGRFWLCFAACIALAADDKPTPNHMLTPSHKLIVARAACPAIKNMEAFLCFVACL